MVRFSLSHGLNLCLAFFILISVLAEASRLYPPRSGSDLKKLFEKIVSSASPDHHKLAVFYYIRKDFPNPGRQAAEKLAKTHQLPGKYKILVDGLWFLDRSKFEVKSIIHFADAPMKKANRWAEREH